MTRNPTLPASAVATANPVRVALVTDDPLLRSALTGLLAQLGDSRVVPLADADVVLWDPGLDSERALGRMRELGALKVPAVAVIASPTHLAPALAAGAKGVVLRGDVGPDLGAALAAVQRGLTVIDAALAPALTASGPTPRPLTGKPRAGGGELTDRERQVVTLLAEGLSNKLIADRLGISDHTAKFHVNGVMAKLGAGTRTEAVVEAVRRGLVTL